MHTNFAFIKFVRIKNLNSKVERRVSMQYIYKYSLGLTNDGHFRIEHSIDLQEIHKNSGDWHFAAPDGQAYAKKDFYGKLTQKDIQSVLDWSDSLGLKIDLIAYGRDADLKKLIRKTIDEIKANYKKARS